MSENRSNHTVYNINYQFVWCPKYRHSVLEDELKTTVEQTIRDVCDEYDYDVLSLHISPDHVHLFVSAHPKHSPSKMVRVLKSITAREAWNEHEGVLKQYFWGSGKNPTILERQEMYQVRLSNSISIVLNTYRMDGIHPRGQAPRHSPSLSVEDGEQTREIDDAVIELFNGNGRAGQFGGVKFLAEDNYEESYAYATRQAFEQSKLAGTWRNTIAQLIQTTENHHREVNLASYLYQSDNNTFRVVYYLIKVCQQTVQIYR